MLNLKIKFMKNTIQLFGISLLSGFIAIAGYKYFSEDNSVFGNQVTLTTAPSYAKPVGLSTSVLDFTEAAEKTVNHVVHVKNVTFRTVFNPYTEFFFGQSGRQQVPQVGTGSGVIISEDGYVVTNYHVVKDAQELEVTLNNNKTYKAKLVGSDSKMDIALIKLDSSDKFSYAVFADSDQVKVGEWVLAVGNPFNLNSTVTAGIVSAKARNLGDTGIQSFIQTDAAVNPGNSGGALVNTRGELVGINTMISSNTGSYVGYSFAVPSNITRKIIEDILEFGNVQRGILGIEGVELNSKAAAEFGVKETQGFYVNKVNKNSGAEKAGLQKGDVVVQIDNQRIASFAEMSGYLSSKRPNDEVQVMVKRNGKSLVIPVKLTKRELLNVEFNGFELEEIAAADKQRFKIKEGVKIKEINNEKFKQYENLLKGSIILSIDGNKVVDMESASRILGSKADNQTVEMEVITQNGRRIQLIL